MNGLINAEEYKNDMLGHWFVSLSEYPTDLVLNQGVIGTSDPYDGVMKGNIKLEGDCSLQCGLFDCEFKSSGTKCVEVDR